MIRVAICDDDIDELNRMRELADVYPDFEIYSYNGPKSLTADIADGKTFDLYLLDIVMPEMDGIELAELIRENNQTAVIIFLTNCGDRALDAFRVRAAQYLSKPIEPETLRVELDIALDYLRNKKSSNFIIKTKSGIRAIPFHKVVYCELKNRRLFCLTGDEETYLSVTLRVPFKELIMPLLDDERFIHPHASFVVNMDYIGATDGNNLILKTGAMVPIARRMRIEANGRYMKYFFKDPEDK